MNFRRLVTETDSIQYHHMLQPCFANMNNELTPNMEDNNPRSLSDIIGDIFLMAAPKSKVSSDESLLCGVECLLFCRFLMLGRKRNT